MWDYLAYEKLLPYPLGRQDSFHSCRRILIVLWCTIKDTWHSNIFITRVFFIRFHLVNDIANFVSINLGNKLAYLVVDFANSWACNHVGPSTSLLLYIPREPLIGFFFPYHPRCNWHALVVLHFFIIFLCSKISTFVFYLLSIFIDSAFFIFICTSEIALLLASRLLLKCFVSEFVDLCVLHIFVLIFLERILIF